MIGVRRRNNYPPTISEFEEEVDEFRRRPWMKKL